jgi:IstB-like ATP binding protein
VSILEPALRQSLRTLKLSGMLHTLDARLAQATAGELGHLDFLQVLCDDEISRRQSMSVIRRIRKARLDGQATLEGFDFHASPRLPAAQIRDLAALRWLHAGESVIPYGRVQRQCRRAACHGRGGLGHERDRVRPVVLGSGSRRRGGPRSTSGCESGVPVRGDAGHRLHAE